MIGQVIVYRKAETDWSDLLQSEESRIILLFIFNRIKFNAIEFTNVARRYFSKL